MPELNLNRFDALADLDNLEAHATPSTDDCSLSGNKGSVQDIRRASKQQATLLIHDSSNQKACSLRVPPGSLKTSAALVSFLQKKGLTVSDASLITMHEDTVPCQLHVVKPNTKAALLSKTSGSADVILHLFNTHNDPSSCILHEFANVHPDCYKTLSDCAEQPPVQLPGSTAAVDFQSYLEAAFEASVMSDSILYNDCDKVDMKAEWCTWNTGLVWKSTASSASAGYIYLFFKRSLSRVGKARLPGFSLLASRQAKPWTMNKPKVISDVEQWLNGAAPPSPPSIDLVTSILAAKLGAPSAEHQSLVASEPCALPGVSVNPTASLPVAASPRPSSPAHQQPGEVGSWRKPAPVATTRAASKVDNSKSSKKKRQRKRSGSASRSDTSGTGPGTPTSPTRDDLKFFGEERFNSLVAILNQACNVQTRSCGWISSLSLNQQVDGNATRVASAEWWAARTSWGV